MFYKTQFPVSKCYYLLALFLGSGLGVLLSALVRIGVAILSMACLIMVEATAAPPSYTVPAAVEHAADSTAAMSAHASASTAFLATLTEQERAWLRAHPVIRVAQDTSWVPVEFADEHQEPSGMSADYLKLVEQCLGVTFARARNLNWFEVMSALKNREIDMTTSVAVTPENSEFLVFTNPYMKIPIVIFTQIEVLYVSDLEMLSGKKVAVGAGYSIADWLARDHPAIQQVKVQNTEEGIARLQNGEVFAYVDNMLVVSYFMSARQASDIRVAGYTPYVNAQCMAVRKDWPILVGILQKALGSISDREKAAIYHKWLPVRYDQAFYKKRIWRAVLLLTGALIGLAAWVLWLFAVIRQRKRAELALSKLSATLEQRVQDRTAELQTANANILKLNDDLNSRATKLEAVNKELEAFSYSVSHDLRAPLRAIDGYARMVTEYMFDRLDDEGRRLLHVISDEAKRMSRLIDDLLAFSRISRQQTEPVTINMHALAQEIYNELIKDEASRTVKFELQELPAVPGTPAMIRQVWVNLISNALKFTRKRPDATIQIGAQLGADGMWVFHVKDNGAGFDMRHVNKLFGVFQRLHNNADYEGTGVGLALVHRIVQRHGGRIWAEAEVDKGACFYFTLQASAKQADGGEIGPMSPPPRQQLTNSFRPPEA